MSVMLFDKNYLITTPLYIMSSSETVVIKLAQQSWRLLRS